jgi:hypothetical protein
MIGEMRESQIAGRRTWASQVWPGAPSYGEMRAVIQRVSEASVAIGGTMKSAIEKGLLVLLAVEEADAAEDIEWLSGKIVRLRIFSDENGLMNLSVQEVQGGILLVSQFTLFASTKMFLVIKALIRLEYPHFRKSPASFTILQRGSPSPSDKR